MKNILVPYDFSPRAMEAFTMAIDIAAKARGEVFLLHVLSIPTQTTTSFVGDPFFFDAKLAVEIQEEAQRELDRVKHYKGSADLLVHTKVVFGQLVSTITAFIHSNNIDLVIMGTSGASGIAEIFIGSNTEKIVRFSPVPVLAVRETVAVHNIKNILYPSTLHLIQSNFIKELKKLQEFFQATLHVLHVNTPTQFKTDQEANKALTEFSKHYNLRNCQLHFRNYRHEDAGIIDFAYAFKMDIIAMPTHARKGLAHIFNASVTESVVNHVQCPIWTYHLDSASE